MKRLFIAGLLAFAPFTWALDQAGSQQLANLQQRWAQIQYQTPKDKRAEAFEKLAADASTLVHQHQGGSDQVVIASLPQSQASQSEAELVLQALGRLWAAGGQLDRGAVHGAARRARVLLPTYPFERQRCWIDPPRGLRVTQATKATVTPHDGTPPPARQSPQAEVAPVTESQTQVMRLWQDLLGVPRIRPHDDFFDLGGNSLLGIQLHTRIKEQFEVEIPLKSLLLQPTVAGMAQLIELAILDEIESMPQS